MRLETGGNSSAPEKKKGLAKPYSTPRDTSPVYPREAPEPAVKAAPRTANEILGIAPFMAKPDPLSFLAREEITPEAAARGRTSGLLSPEQDQADQAKQAEERRAEREKVLGITTGALSTTPEMLKEQLHQLTDEEYAKLSPKQRVAVDFNSLLSTAVRKDLKRQDRYADVSEQQKATYEKSVENMFGEDRGSELYAPETMAVLRQLKIEDPADDLDDYLSMKVAITEEDLKNITTTQPAPNYAIDGRVPEETRGKLSVVEGLVDKTQQMQEQIAKGKEMLQSFLATAAAERSEDLGRLGGSSPLASRPALGFRPAEFTESGAPADLNTYFRSMFDALSDEKQADARPQLLEALKVDLRPDELEAFMSYSQARVRNSREYGALMGSNEGAEYTSPKEFRKLLGLDK